MGSRGSSSGGAGGGGRPISASSLPALEGSERQVSWAEDIRRQRLAEYNSLIQGGDNSEAMGHMMTMAVMHEGAGMNPTRARMSRQMALGQLEDRVSDTEDSIIGNTSRRDPGYQKKVEQAARATRNIVLPAAAKNIRETTSAKDWIEWGREI